jgi:PIN domain nuclease of toxin-antitoxin system
LKGFIKYGQFSCRGSVGLITVDTGFMCLALCDAACLGTAYSTGDRVTACLGTIGAAYSTGNRVTGI